MAQMSFADDAFGWDDFYNLSTAPMVDNNAYMGFLNYDLPLTVCMDSQWTNFDTLLYPLPPFNPCAIEAYTTPHLYDLPQVTIPPTQPFPAVAATCTPLTWASSPSSSRESSPSSGSDTSSERGGSKASNGNAAMEQGVTRGRRSAVRPAPYSINERPGISGAVHTSTSTSAPSGYGAFGPADAAYMESPRRKIQNEFEILSTTLGKLGIKQVRHHPYLTCPVLDCKKGGLNDLLHGGTSASLATTALRLSASASTPTSTPRSKSSIIHPHAYAQLSQNHSSVSTSFRGTSNPYTLRKQTSAVVTRAAMYRPSWTRKQEETADLVGRASCGRTWKCSKTTARIFRKN